MFFFSSTTENVTSTLQRINSHKFTVSHTLLPSNLAEELFSTDKVLNPILYTNMKLFKIGFIEDDKCTFCKQEAETLHHLMFHCFFSKKFWRHFESYFHSISNQQVRISLRDVLFGVITSKCILLNYLLIILSECH